MGLNHILPSFLIRQIHLNIDNSDDFINVKKIKKPKVRTKEGFIKGGRNKKHTFSFLPSISTKFFQGEEENIYFIIYQNYKNLPSSVAFSNSIVSYHCHFGAFMFYRGKSLWSLEL